MAFEEWKKQAIEKIDDLVEDVINDNQGNPDFEEEDMLTAADVAISDVMAEAGLNVNEETPLRTAIATDLAKGWIDFAYSNWYTGDTPKEENEKLLIKQAIQVY